MLTLTPLDLATWSAVLTKGGCKRRAEPEATRAMTVMRIVMAKKNDETLGYTQTPTTQPKHQFDEHAKSRWVMGCDPRQQLMPNSRRGLHGRCTVAMAKISSADAHRIC